MVRLDDKLLFDACSLVNGKNVHRLKEMIFDYEQAVDLHNQQSPTHKIYRIQSELKLRRYVRVRQEKEIKRQTVIAIDCASLGSRNSSALVDKYEELEKNLAVWECRWR